jgi:hypothetical protein
MLVREQTTLYNDYSLGDLFNFLIDKYDEDWLEAFRKYVQKKIAPLAGNITTLSLYSGAGGY